LAGLLATAHSQTVVRQLKEENELPKNDRN